jgi:hypothetical protein
MYVLTVGLSEFFMWRIFAILQKKKKKLNILLQVPFLFYKKAQKIFKISKNHHNYLKHERVLKNCLLSSFEYCQI